MGNDQVDRTVVTQGPTEGAGQETVRTDSRHITRAGPGGAELTRRIVVLVFGLIQIVIEARIVLLLLAAREANARNLSSEVRHRCSEIRLAAPPSAAG